jgi:hypothetical protein
LEHNISNIRKEVNIILQIEFNARTTSHKYIILKNTSNPIALWLDDVLGLSYMYKRRSKYLSENLFDKKLIKICSCQNLIICNGLMKWSKHNKMACMHKLCNGFLNCVINNIFIYH